MKVENYMQMQMQRLVILCFVFTTCAGAAADHISMNRGREWGGDAATKGASTVRGQLITAVDPLPYSAEARICRSPFSYSFHLTPGQKFICLHDNPHSYHAFQSLHAVEAGPFTLLPNSSASITAPALSLHHEFLAKVSCIVIQQNQPFNILFTPENRYSYAFISGIETRTLSSTISNCHGGDHVLAQKSLIYVDNTSSLERVYYRKNMKLEAVLLKRKFIGLSASTLKHNATHSCDTILRVNVDVGFKFRAHVSQQRGSQSISGFSTIFNMCVSFEGSKASMLARHGGRLSGPDSLPPKGDSPPHSIQSLLCSLLGRKNAIATLVFAVITLLNIIVHSLLKMWVPDITEIEDENKPSARAKRLCRTFSLAEIQSATDNFHNGFIVGKGGFGKVYKGFIDNGREIVAIKRLKPDSKQGELQFWTEVETLSKLQHVNLVSLIGCCIEEKEMILVYEYMPYGTLADHLYGLARKSTDFFPLSWKQRLKICIGAGRALDYLHTGNGIIHRDVKASNILLDEKFVAKVSDFGLAKTGTVSESQSQDSTNLKGTFGYIDPNYFRTRKLTKKSDTYSFGVVLLEVLCGRPAVEPWNEEHKRSLIMWAIYNISKGRVDHIIASCLRGEISPDCLKTFVKVVERCLHDEPKKRPPIAHVVIKLELALQQQVNAESLASNERIGVEDVFSFTDMSEENMILIVPNEQINAADALPQKENAGSSAHNEIINVTDAMPCTDEKKSVANDLPGEQNNSTRIASGRRDGRKSMMLKISRKLWPWDAFGKTRKPSTKTDLVGISVRCTTKRYIVQKQTNDGSCT